MDRIRQLSQQWLPYVEREHFFETYKQRIENWLRLNVVKPEDQLLYFFTFVGAKLGCYT